MKTVLNLASRVFVAVCLTLLAGLQFSRAQDLRLFEPVAAGCSLSAALMLSICAAHVITHGGRR